MAVTSLGDPLPFNISTMEFVLAQFGTVVSFAFIINYYGVRLQREMNSIDLPSRRILDDKLRSMRLGSISIAVGQLAGVSGVIVFWALGSAPFQWVLMFTTFLALPASVVMTTLGIFKNVKVKDALVVGDMVKSSSPLDNFSKTQT